jgi:hypothetical protein
MSPEVMPEAVLKKKSLAKKDVGASKK